MWFSFHRGELARTLNVPEVKVKVSKSKKKNAVGKSVYSLPWALDSLVLDAFKSMSFLFFIYGGK